MAEVFQGNVLVRDVDGDERPVSKIAVRDAMSRLERFQKDRDPAHGVVEGPDGELRVKMGGEKGGMKRTVTASALRAAWAKVRA